jgi:hypothetical protein
MSEAGRLAEQRLGLRVRQGYSLKIARLNSTSNGPSGRQRLKLDPATSPLYGKELGMHRRDGDRSIVYLLFGMPPELVYEAAAHEYAHVWQAENCAAELAPELREGFAQWVAADILRAKGFFKALERLEKRQDIPYGTGYQRLKSLPKSSILALLRAR